MGRGSSDDTYDGTATTRSAQTGARPTVRTIDQDEITHLVRDGQGAVGRAAASAIGKEVPESGIDWENIPTGEFLPDTGEELFDRRNTGSYEMTPTREAALEGMRASFMRGAVLHQASGEDSEIRDFVREVAALIEKPYIYVEEDASTPLFERREEGTGVSIGEAIGAGALVAIESSPRKDPDPPPEEFGVLPVGEERIFFHDHPEVGWVAVPMSLQTHVIVIRPGGDRLEAGPYQDPVDPHHR